MLNGFDEFGRCMIEPKTGLHEVWFSYDDEAEYVYRALRAAPEILSRSLANQLFDHPVIYSLLVDGSGSVQGYRVISDPREDPSTRIDADLLALPLRAVVFGLEGWSCTDLPRSENERPFGGRLIKEVCEKRTSDARIAIETHVYRKAGQGIGRVALTPDPNEFDVRIRVEVLSLELAQ
jgi:hypothetical protein